MTSKSSSEETTLRLVRTFAAPCERVFAAWVSSEALRQWWWPAQFATLISCDLRVGGTYRFKSTGLPEGRNIAVSGTFREVDAPRRLVYTWQWDGEVATTLVAVEFHERDGGTELILIHALFDNEEERANHHQGWSDCIDRLESFFREAGS
ncbi:MAG: SRPBCC domain-containing protein [Chloroflexales bacterium]|nr:SRPBCC domain-containing protein [Chloroflexales bacterium]